jgi:hypothetical protein
VHVILDVSRLLFSIRRAAPSGIDRVEMAYARRWAARTPAGCTFVAQIPAGGFSAVPRPALVALLDAIEAAWDGVSGAQRQAWRAALPLFSQLGLGAGRRALRDALAAPNQAVAGRSVFLWFRTARLTGPRPSRRSAAPAPPSSPSSMT